MHLVLGDIVFQRLLMIFTSCAPHPPERCSPTLYFHHMCVQCPVFLGQLLGNRIIGGVSSHTPFVGLEGSAGPLLGNGLTLVKARLRAGQSRVSDRQGMLCMSCCVLHTAHCTMQDVAQGVCTAQCARCAICRGCSARSGHSTVCPNAQHFAHKKLCAQWHCAHCTLHTWHTATGKICIPQARRTAHSVHRILHVPHTAQRTRHILRICTHCTLHNVYSANMCTVWRARCAMCSVQCVWWCSVQCAVFKVCNAHYAKMDTVQCAKCTVLSGQSAWCTM